MREASFGLLLLASCSQARTEEPKERIACAVAGAAEFTEDGGLERASVEGAQVLIIRHPDGGFRRLEVSKDGQSLLAADGAQAAQSALKSERWEVILEDNRYVIPVKADAPRQ